MPIPGGTLTTTTGTWSNFVSTALDLETSPYLREEPIFRAFTDKRPQRQAHPAQTVTLTIEGELPLATTPLNESLDVDAVGPSAVRTVSVTMNEYGNVMSHTHLLRQVDWSQDTAMRIGRELGLNASRSVDKVYQTVLDGATNVAWMAAGGLALADPGAANRTKITSQGVSTAKTLLRRRNAVPRFGGISACVIHPDVLHDLFAESGPNTWRQPHEMVDTSNLYNRVAGDYMGVRFIENSKCTVTTVAPGTGPDVYNTYFPDQEALVELVGDDVRTVVADPIDALQRFYRVGWYALLGVTRFRENAIQLVKSSSSIESTFYAGSLPTYDGKA